MQHEVYMAFSIHRTNAFITANKIIEVPDILFGEIEIDGLKFTTARSRTQSLRGATKLLSSNLNNSKGSPTTDPEQVLEFFTKLGELGWTVDSDRFKEKHKTKLAAAAKKREKAKADAEAASVAVAVPATETAATVDQHPEQVDDPNLPETAADVPDRLEAPAEPSPASEGTGEEPESSE